MIWMKKQQRIGEKYMKNPTKLSKKGYTKFEIQNMDYPFLVEAINRYYKDLIAEPDDTFKFMTKDFCKDSVERLIEVFKCGG